MIGIFIFLAGFMSLLEVFGLISTDIKLNISARNKFSGTIDSINQGEINSELVIDIGNGDKIASVITTNSIETLNIKEGMQVSAIIKASDVMLGK